MSSPRELICELSRQFYAQGWVSGTGGGISIRDGDILFMAPSGVQKERLQPSDIFEVNFNGDVTRTPSDGGKLTACAPLFMNVFNQRDAGAVIHSHSQSAVLATLIFDTEFRITEIEMLKGIRATGYHDELVVPIIENTAEESELAETMAAAIDSYPQSDAVLVRRHGVYVWGNDWIQAKTQAESYDYLFSMAVEMRKLGIL